MANEDVSRIMQNKPHLRYSLAFVHIKVRCKGAARRSFSFQPCNACTRACVCVCTLWNYIARASVVVSQLVPHSGVNYVYLEHPLRSHLSASPFIRVIFRALRRAASPPGDISPPRGRETRRLWIIASLVVGFDEKSKKFPPWQMLSSTASPFILSHR